MTNAIEEIRAINKSIGEIGSFVKERTDGLSGDVSLLKEENERLKLDVGSVCRSGCASAGGRRSPA